jgi:hypothetical protein
MRLVFLRRSPGFTRSPGCGYGQDGWDCRFYRWYYHSTSCSTCVPTYTVVPTDGVDIGKGQSSSGCSASYSLFLVATNRCNKPQEKYISFDIHFSFLFFVSPAVQVLAGQPYVYHCSISVACLCSSKGIHTQFHNR